MTELNNKIKKRIAKDAHDHAKFLAHKVFMPAYEMAYIHGCKHGRNDMRNEPDLNLDDWKNSRPGSYTELVLDWSEFVIDYDTVTVTKGKEDERA